MTAQYLWSLVTIAAYLLLCWGCLGRRKPARVYKASGNDAGDQLLVAYASQGGQAEQLARYYADSLQQRHSVVLVSLNQLDRDLIASTSLALFIVSTYGEGEPPDNALRFQQQWLRNPVNDSLSHLRFAVLALGDSQYRHFCRFGASLAAGLNEYGASQLFDTVRVDSMNAEHLAAWQQHLCRHGVLDGPAIPPAPGEVPFNKGLLIKQTCINVGSPGEPAWYLRITAPADTSWQAGDILEILPGNDPASPVREYSIASLPEDESIDLLVRQTIKQDGSLGLGSGWLTRDATPGSGLMLRVRRNPAFHAPAKDSAMILIGNGTGMAGLRAHLKARELSGSKQNCLFFGERTREHDFFFQDDIEHWQVNGFLPQLHLSFSRDQNQKRYVQDLLIEQAALIREWVAQEATLYVCGSLEGMAGGVDRALQTILGSQRLEAMKIAGTYARDVY